MEADGWRRRLADAIAASGKSMRAVSLASGNAAGYVHSIIKDAKDPTVQNLIAVCNAVPVSLVYVLYGFDVSPADERILRMLQDNPDARDGILAILRGFEKS